MEYRQQYIYICIFIVNFFLCILPFIWYQVFWSNTNNFQIDLIYPWKGPKQVLSLRVRFDLGVITMKRYSTLLKSPELETHHQIKFSLIHRKLYLGVLRLCTLMNHRILRLIDWRTFLLLEIQCGKVYIFCGC